MIRIYDSIVLATTKLRTRKIRTLLAVFISALLFGLLVAASLMTNGAFKSIGSFSSEGYGDKYLVQVMHDISDPGVMKDKRVWNRAEDIYKEIVTEKKAVAKSLGIEYDGSSEIKPVSENTLNPDDRYLNFQSIATQRALAERKAAKLSPGLPELKTIAEAYHPKAFYVSNQVTAKDGTLTPMINDKEKFELQTNYADQPQNPVSLGLSVTDAVLLKPFVQSDIASKSEKDSIPIVISYSAAEKELGLQTLDQSASASQKIERIKEINTKSTSIKFEACYRNTASQQLLQDALRAAKYIEDNKGKKDFTEPVLSYAIPKQDSCGQVAIVKDKRPAAEKLVEQKQKQFDAQFGGVVAADQYKLRFNVIGVMPTDESSTNSAETAGDLLNSIVGTNANFGATSPDSSYKSLSNAKRLREILTPATNPVFPVSPETLYVEFNNPNDARHFIRDKGCTTRQDGSCWTPDRQFQLIAFGSNSLAVDDLKNRTVMAISYVALAVAALTAIIMGSTVGRMIADGRKESAIFRAVGFKRIDIAMIYIAYYLILSTLISIISLGIGFTMAYAINATYAADITMQAQLAFNVTDFSKTFSLFSVDFTQIGIIISGVFVVGFVGIIIPLLRNVRRNPIDDLRDE